MKVCDVYWLAGLIEGEGSFSSSRSFCIQVTMTDKDVLQRVYDLLNIKRDLIVLKKRENRKQAWKAAINSSHAIGLMMTIYSLMGERRQHRIRDCITLWSKEARYNKFKTHCIRGHEFTPENTSGEGRRQCRTCERKVHSHVRKARKLQRVRAL